MPATQKQHTDSVWTKPLMCRTHSQKNVTHKKPSPLCTTLYNNESIKVYTHMENKQITEKCYLEALTYMRAVDKNTKKYKVINRPTCDLKG